MSLTRIVCPECGAGLKSGSGFSVGETVSCPKCESAFVVEDPDDEDRPAKKPVRAAASRAADDEDEDEKPRKRRRREDDDDDEYGGGKTRSYKNSPLRYAILGVLVVVMIVLGVMLYQKKKKEREEANAPNQDDTPAAVQPVGGPGPRPIGGPRPGGPPEIAPVFPPGNQFPPPGAGAVVRPGGPAGGMAVPPFGLSGGTVDLQKLRAELSQKLVGTWEGTAPDGGTFTVTYQANGQYTQRGGGAVVGGMYQVAGLVGTKGLKLNRDGKTVTAVFEDDELIQDTGTPGQSVVLRKK